MMLRTDVDHLPATIREELLHVAAILFETFEETTKGRCSEHFRADRILTLILHGPHAERDWEDVAPGEAFRLLAIVNYSRLARSERDWRLMRDRLRRAWEHGEIGRPVRLSVESLERGAHLESVLGLRSRELGLEIGRDMGRSLGRDLAASIPFDHGRDMSRGMER